MNAARRGELWDRLRQSGIVAGDLPDDISDMSPWYVRAMIGAAAWIAALFLLLAVGMGLAEMLKSPVATMAAGFVMCGAAITLMRANPSGVFTSQLALAGSLAGQALVAYALFDRAQPLALAPWLWLGAFEVALVVLAPNYVHRMLAALAALVAVRFALDASGLAALFPALAVAGFVLVQINETRLAPRAALWQPIAIALALAALVSAGASTLGTDWLRLLGTRAPFILPGWIGSVAIAVILIATAWRLMRDARIAATTPMAMGAWLALAALIAAGWPMPGLAVALIVMLVAFATGHGALLGLATLALLAVLSHYYYSLDATLLVKSCALLATGLVLLGSRLVLQRVTTGERGDSHA